MEKAANTVVPRVGSGFPVHTSVPSMITAFWAFYMVMIDRHSSLPLLSEWLFFLISDFWTRLSIENMVRRASRKGLSLSDSKIH